MMWKQIPDYPHYYASTDGEIYSEKTGKILKPSLSKFGYLRVTLRKNKREKHKIMVHRLVALAFIENPDKLPQVNHINENKLDNRVENLEWCSCSYNINYGNRNAKVSAKLREEKQAAVAKRILQINIEDGTVTKIWNSMREIERELKISHSNIYACCTGKRKTRGGYRWEYAN